jgi:hypothetical protein
MVPSLITSSPDSPRIDASCIYGQFDSAYRETRGKVDIQGPRRRAGIRAATTKTRLSCRDATHHARNHVLQHVVGSSIGV